MQVLIHGILSSSLQTICQSWQPNCQPWKLTTSISAILEAKLSLSAARLDNCKSWKFEVVALALLGFHMSACYRTASVCVLGFHMSACCAFRHPEAISLCSRARRFSGFGAAAALQLLAEGGRGGRITLWSLAQPDFMETLWVIQISMATCDRLCECCRSCFSR